MLRRTGINRGTVGFKPRTTTMKSAAFARVAAKEAGAVSKLRKTLTTSRPKMTPIRRAARGQDCTLQFPAVCNFDPATTVLCHSNYLADGKGMGLKAPDEKACFGCAACHDVLDGRRPRPDWLSYDAMQTQFHYAVERTHQVLRHLGLMAAAPTNIETEQS